MYYFLFYLDYPDRTQQLRKGITHLKSFSANSVHNRKDSRILSFKLSVKFYKYVSLLHHMLRFSTVKKRATQFKIHLRQFLPKQEKHTRFFFFF